jgi:glycosyltransferase 2 family protein
MKREQLLTVIKVSITVLIIGFSIYFSVWKVDFGELGRSFTTANYWYALLIVPIILLSHYVRALRWHVILERIHPEVRTGNLFAGVMIGYFMNNLIPRSGEIVRPWFTAQTEKDTSFSSLLGSIIVERFIDTVALLLVIAAILFFDQTLFNGFEEIGVDAGVVQPILYMAIALGVVFIIIAPSRIGLWMAETLSTPLLWAARLPGLGKLTSLRDGVLSMFRKLQLGFGAIKSVRQVLLVSFHTVLLYFLYLLPLYIMFFAFGSGEHGETTMFAALEIWAVTALGYAVAPTPGAFGVFHATARIALMKFAGFTEADAVAYATLTHFVNYLVPIALGIYYLLTRNISMSTLLKARSAS